MTDTDSCVSLQLEQAGATISQTLSGLILDSEADSDPNSTQPILSFFLVLNVIQFFGILGLWYLSRRQRLQEVGHRQELIMASPNRSETSLENEANTRESSLPRIPHRTTSSEHGRSKRERKAEKRMRRRGKVFWCDMCWVHRRCLGAFPRHCVSKVEVKAGEGGQVASVDAASIRLICLWLGRSI